MQRSALNYKKILYFLTITLEVQKQFPNTIAQKFPKWMREVRLYLACGEGTRRSGRRRERTCSHRDMKPGAENLTASGGGKLDGGGGGEVAGGRRAGGERGREGGGEGGGQRHGGGCALLCAKWKLARVAAASAEQVCKSSGACVVEKGRRRMGATVVNARVFVPPPLLCKVNSPISKQGPKTTYVLHIQGRKSLNGLDLFGSVNCSVIGVLSYRLLKLILVFVIFRAKLGPLHT